MKQILTPANAAFAASSKTITFSTTIPTSISSILHVTNVTTGTLMFQPQAGLALSGTFSTPTLSLNCSTVGMADTDQLFIVWDDGKSTVTSAVGEESGASAIATSALAANLVIKGSAGTLISLVGYSARTSLQFIQIHNSAALPVDTAVPIYSFVVPALSNFSLDVPITGIPFATGIVVCNSSTVATKNIGSADCWFTAVFK